MKYKGTEYYKNIICKIVSDKFGKIISDNFVNSITKIQVECINKHIFNITPAKIQQGRWCKLCRITPYKNIEDFVISKGGTIRKVIWIFLLY